METIKLILEILLLFINIFVLILAYYVYKSFTRQELFKFQLKDTIKLIDSFLSIDFRIFEYNNKDRKVNTIFNGTIEEFIESGIVSSIIEQINFPIYFNKNVLRDILSLQTWQGESRYFIPKKIRESFIITFKNGKNIKFGPIEASLQDSGLIQQILPNENFIILTYCSTQETILNKDFNYFRADNFDTFNKSQIYALFFTKFSQIYCIIIKN